MVVLQIEVPVTASMRWTLSFGSVWGNNSPFGIRRPRRFSFFLNSWAN